MARTRLTPPGTGPAAEKQQSYLAKMEEACGQMIGLIGEILDLSKLEAGKLAIDPHPLDLSALTAEVVQRFSPAAAQKGIALRVERVAQPAMVLADQIRLDQVLMNLLMNAVKFTPRSGAITVEVIDLGNEVEVGVIDTGPGIAPEEIPLLFEKFSQVASAKNTSVQGTGLGLVICRHLIEAHSGRIWAESQPGQGARFAFRLPLIARQASTPGRVRSILVVDDDARVASFLAELLAADGHSVEIAATGQAALQQLEHRPYDVIVADIRLPDLDGAGVYREIARRRPALCSRFIFITGYTLTPETREFLAQTGAPCLSKPFALEELEGFVRRIPLNPAVDEATVR